MTIFLTGASGLVGAAFARAAARRGHRVTGLVGTFAGAIEGLAVQRAVDLTREGDVTAAVLDVFPQAIVNCAAVSVPEQCDADPALAQALNVALPATFARLAHHVGARLVHLSSEQVFDGARSTPYAATDPVSPINLYGRQKVESERAVHAAAPEWAVTLRAPLLMGNSLVGRRSNHERLFADWAAGRTPRLFTDEFRQTCTAENLAEVMVELCERRDPVGIFHWAGADLLSRHALGLRIREHFKLTPAQAPIAEATRPAAPEIARKRQACLALDLSSLAGKLKTRPQSIAEQLAELNVPPPARAWYHGL
ncbi:MAG: sugar nucleotide-binding protein [Opitutaceae bacterium]|nr:sugar nucleotide-binding protein [Opitutaceae bacterium]